jgi:YihY family inner membrane protein
MADAGGIGKQIGWRIRSFLQKLMICASLFDRNELINHAAASALFILLAIPPFFLLLIIGLDRYLSAVPEISARVFDFLRSINQNLDRDFLVRIGLLSVRTGAFGLLGLLSLLWAGRRAILAVRRGLSAVFTPEGSRTPLKVHLFSLGVLLLMVAALMVGTFVSVAVQFILGVMAHQPIVREMIPPLLPFLQQLVPAAMTVLMVFLAYRFVPPQRPGTVTSAVGALLCAGSVLLVHSLFSRFTGVAQYSVIYGVTGSVILLIIWIHLTFVLFFFFAQFVFVLEKLDQILLERLYLLYSASSKTGEGWLDRQLLFRPERLFKNRLVSLSAGTRLFSEGDEETDVYFLFSGRIGIFLGDGKEERRIAAIEPGETLGEMAHLLGKPRSTTAIVEKDAQLLVIGVDTFEELVRKSPSVARGMLQLLSRRLRRSLDEFRP